MKMVKNNLLHLLLNLLGFSEDNVAFPLDSTLLKLRVLENIGEDIDTLRDVGVECLGKVYGVLALSGVSSRSSMPYQSKTTHRCIGIQVSTHILDLELQLLLRPVGRALDFPSVARSLLQVSLGITTLKARCSRKCAVPFVSSVSALDPASIHIPTVDVCAHGEYSVAI
jgi:hypothetical protein